MSQPGLTDEQVDQLLDALLDFRDALMNLTDRFHQRMAKVEQELSAARQKPIKSYEAVSKTLARPERMTLQDLSIEPGEDFSPTRLEKPDTEPEADLFDLGDEEDFALLDFDDDDDDDF